MNLKNKVLEIAKTEGVTKTKIPNIEVYKLSKPFPRISAISASAICFIIQGEKVLYINDQEYNYNEDNYLISSLNLPIETELKVASKENPYLGVIVYLDGNIIGDIIEQFHSKETLEKINKEERILAVEKFDNNIKDCLYRLLSISTNEIDSKILSEPLLKELFYNILKTKNGNILINNIKQMTKSNILISAIKFIEENYRENISIEYISKKLNISNSKLHTMFKKTIGTSPIQYVKKLRLQNAYSLISQGMNSTTAAFESGYSNQSQFCREFKREYGITASEIKSQIKN